MERRTALFAVLAIAIWYGWLMIFPPPVAPTPGPEPTATEPAPAPTPVPAPVPVAPAAPRSEHRVDACDARSVWRSDGGLSDLTLPRFRAPYHVTAVHSWVLGGFGPFEPYGDDPGPARVLTSAADAFAVGAGPLENAPIALTGPPSDAHGTSGPIAVRHQLVPRPEAPDSPCRLTMSLTWTNTGSAPWSGPLWVGVHDRLPEASGGMFARYDSLATATAYVDGGVNHLAGYADLTGPEPLEGPAGWFGIGDRYFGALASLETPHGTVVQTRRASPTGPLDGLHWMVDATLAPGQSHTEVLQIYLGPKDLDVLRAVQEDLGDAVELGWFAFFARPLLFMLKLFHGATGNWGLAIILLTFTVKIVFFPLTQSAFKSGQAMQAIQPALQEIREKYADNSEELNRRTMELFKENKVNPLGGCLPMLLQFPVWIALYNVLLSSVELYQSEFLFLKDLSSIDPYEVLPIVVTALIMIQQQFTPMGNMDPAQARMMKLMPLFFGIFFFTLPSGLMVYILVNTVLSVLQQWFIKRSFPSPTVTAPAGI